MGYLFAALLFLAALPAGAGEPAQAAPDAEQLSHDMISGVDGWLGSLKDKLQSDKPITEEDFDSLFGDSFLSGPEDPADEIEKTEARLNEKLGGASRVSDTYGRWLEKRLSPADLAPEVTRSRRYVTVNFRTPADAVGPARADVRRGRIHIGYDRKAEPQAPPAARRRHFVMAVPPDADPAGFRIKRRKGDVSVIFDRLEKGKKRTEATK